MSLKVSNGLVLDYSDFQDEGLRIFICGMSGSGKSHAAKVLVEKVISAGFPAIIVDPEGEYASLKELFKTIVVGGKYADVDLDLNMVQEYVKTCLELDVNLVFDISQLFKSKQDEFASKILEVIFVLESEYRKSIFVVFEECQIMAPQTAASLPKLDMSIDLAKRGRKRGVNSIWISQRPSSVSKDVISQCNVYFFGKLQTHDITQIKDHLDRAGVAPEEIMSLEKEFYYYYHDQAGKVVFRPINMRDLASTPLPRQEVEIREAVTDKSLQAAIKELAKVAEERKKEEEARQDRLEQLEKEKEQFGKELEKAQEKISRLDHDLNLVSRLKISMEGGSPEVVDKIKEMEESLQEKEALISKLEQEKESFQDAVDNISKEKKELEKQADLLASEIDKLSKFKEEREKVLSKLLEVLKSLGVEFPSENAENLRKQFERRKKLK